MGSHFGVQLTCGKMFLGSRFQWKIFIASVGDHTRPRYETNEFGFFAGYRETALYRNETFVLC